MYNKYNNGKIYKIEHIYKTDSDIYIGSTTKKLLYNRLERHIEDYNLYKSNNKCVSKINSFLLFDKYGVDNIKITLLENVNVETKNELLKREAYYIKSIKCVNKVVPLRTKKEYRDDTKEHIKEYSQQYYQDNKEKLKTKCECICGSTYTLNHKSDHFEYLRSKVYSFQH
jgi:ribosome-interacting GTPase 1